MKKISEMTEDEVRDYALQLEGEKSAFAEKEKNYQAREKELDDLNKALQKRNNELFLKVEQQNGVEEKEENKSTPEEKTETCEDFARRLIEGGN